MMQVEARFEERSGRRVITRLVIEAEVVDAAVLRRVPLRQLEARANIPPGHQPGRIRWNEGEQASLARPSNLRLRRPDGNDPAGFSRRVADAYNAVVATTHRPAAVLAEAAGVPVTTVHRWIREARQRGFLPPARKGRAG